MGDPTGRPNEHAREHPWRVAMLAQEIADARTVAAPDERVVGDDVVKDDEVRFVLDPRTRSNRADEVVGLLA